MAEDQSRGERVNIHIELPQITPQGKKAAQEIANAVFTLEVDGKTEDYLASEITPELLKAEAERLAGIPDAQKRANEILSNMSACLTLVRDCQKLASIFAQHADGLETVARQLKLMGQLTVDKMKIRGERTEGS